MKNEKQILELYVCNDGEIPVITKPFLQRDYVYATEKHILIRISKKVIDGEYEYSEKPKCDIHFIETRVEKIIYLSDFKRVFKNIPTIDEIISRGEYIECTECNGKGQVEWEYSGKIRIYEEDFHCPVCNGSGYESEPVEFKTGNKVIDPKTIFSIHDKNFMYFYLEIIVKTMEYMNIDRVIYKYNQNSTFEQSIFEFDENVSVLIMPTTNDPEYIII